MIGLVWAEAFIVTLRNNLPALHREEGRGLSEIVWIGKSVIEQLRLGCLIGMRSQIAHGPRIGRPRGVCRLVRKARETANVRHSRSLFFELALVYGHILDPCDMRFKIFLWVRRVIALVASRVVFQAETFALSPILFGTYRAWGKPAAASWANIFQRPIHAI